METNKHSIRRRIRLNKYDDTLNCSCKGRAQKIGCEINMLKFSDISKISSLAEAHKTLFCTVLVQKIHNYRVRKTFEA